MSWRLGHARCRGTAALSLAALFCCCLILPPRAGAEPPGAEESLELLGSEASAPIQELLRWLIAGGSSWRPGLRIRMITPTERGLVTLQDRDAHRHGLLSVTLNRTLSAPDCVRNASSLVNQLPKRTREAYARSHALLHICFIEHYLVLREASAWWPFLQTLPASLSHLPLLTKLNVSELLEGSPLLGDILKHQRDLEEQYSEIVWEVPAFAQIATLAQFMFTYCVVESHSHARHHADETTPLLVPLIDLINHRSVGENLRLGYGTGDDPDLVIHIGAHKVGAGEQLFFKYSDDGEASSKFFKQFGFVDPELPVAGKIMFPLTPTHPYYYAKRTMFDQGILHTKKMLESMYGKDKEYKLTHPKAFDFPKFLMYLCKPESGGFRPFRENVARDDLIPYGRFVLFEAEPPLDTIEELHNVCDLQVKPPKCHEALSAKKEVEVERYLTGVVTEQLSRYPTSASADEERLATMQMRDAEYPYIRMRRDEKRCLGTLLGEIREAFLHPSNRTRSAGEKRSSGHEAASEAVDEVSPPNGKQELDEGKSSRRGAGTSADKFLPASDHERKMEDDEDGSDSSPVLTVFGGCLMAAFFVLALALRRWKSTRHTE